MSIASQTFSLSSFRHQHKISTIFNNHVSYSIDKEEREQQEQDLLLLAEKALKDPLLKQEICDRILVLMQQDIQQEKERCQPTGRKL
jgi:hypothetical protein